MLLAALLLSAAGNPTVSTRVPTRSVAHGATGVTVGCRLLLQASEQPTGMTEDLEAKPTARKGWVYEVSAVSSTIQTTGEQLTCTHPEGVEFSSNLVVMTQLMT